MRKFDQSFTCYEPKFPEIVQILDLNSELVGNKQHFFSPKIFRKPLHLSQIKKSRARSLWIGELEERFLSVINIIGQQSSPTEIHYHMNIIGLSPKQVSSHLQKFRNKSTSKFDFITDTHNMKTASCMSSSICGTRST